MTKWVTIQKIHSEMFSSSCAYTHHDVIHWRRLIIDDMFKIWKIEHLKNGILHSHKIRKFKLNFKTIISEVIIF